MLWMIWVAIATTTILVLWPSYDALAFAWLLIPITSILIAYDASGLGVGRLTRARLDLTAVERMGPWEWWLASLVLFGIFAPLYAIKRSTLAQMCSLAQDVEPLTRKDLKLMAKEPSSFFLDEDRRVRKERSDLEAGAIVLLFAAAAVVILVEVFQA